MELIKDDETLDDLQLNGLHIIQKKNDFRFGVDAVLLANFAKIKTGAIVMDMCTGSGIIPIILAGKTAASFITGIEIQGEIVEMANRSVKYNSLSNKISFINGDLRDKELLKKIPRADVVTVNPPYKLKNSGILCSDEKEAIARHEICCELEDAISAARTLLKDNGRFYMVHRPERLIDIFILMRKYRIEPKEIQMVHPDSRKAPNIVLIEGQRDGKPFLKWKSPLFIYDHNSDGGKAYSEEINNIYCKNNK